MSDSRHIAARMAEVAQALLDTLSADQRRAAQWAFPSDEERRLWFYTPTDHGGLTIGEMSPSQQRLAMRLLATGLSRAGNHRPTIMGLENVLDELEGWRVLFGFDRGRDPARYYLACSVRLVPTPGRGVSAAAVSPFTIRSSRARCGHFTPCFFGADPASSPLLGKRLLRPLAAHEDLAFELLRSLSAEQSRSRCFRRFRRSTWWARIAPF